MRLLITLCVLALTQLMFNVVEATPRSHLHLTAHRAEKKSTIDENRRKPKLVKTSSHKHKSPPRHKSQSIKKKLTLGHKRISNQYRSTAVKVAVKHRSTPATSQLAAIHMDAKHHQRYQIARQTAMNKLMKQLGKPYQWGGASPSTGFDCSGLVYYAYKDLVKFKLPRSADQMYHLRDVAPVERRALQKGDLVFFRIHSHTRADHVGVYLGSGKFIQSPSTGKDIQISELTQSYWQKHYIGARRMMTPKTIR